MKRPDEWWWTPEQLADLSSRYPNERTADIARDLGRGLRSVYQKAIALGLKKSSDYLASEDAGRFVPERRASEGTQFRSGDAPWNKGRSFDAGGRSHDTRFKKGRPASESPNYVPLGTERISRDGYLERKVTDDLTVNSSRRWVAVHRLVWEDAHGPIPGGHIVVFKPGCATTDRAEISADRLECITRVENMHRNSYHNNYPKEVGQLIQLRGALNRKIKNRSKQHEEQGQ